MKYLFSLATILKISIAFSQEKPTTLYVEIGGPNMMYSLNAMHSVATKKTDWSMSYRAGAYFVRRRVKATQGSGGWPSFGGGPEATYYYYGGNAGVSWHKEGWRRRKPEFGISAAYNSIDEMQLLTLVPQAGWRYDYENYYLRFNFCIHVGLMKEEVTPTLIGFPLIALGVGFK